MRTKMTKLICGGLRGGGRGERETEPVPRHLGFPGWEILETSLEEVGQAVPRLLGE